MLLHIPTKGILDYIWNGKFMSESTSHGLKKVPVLEACSFKNTVLDNPEEWIEIRESSTFAKTIRTYYPWINLVFGDNGELIKVVPDVYLEKEQAKIEQKEKEEKIKQKKKAEAKKRGYNRIYNLRPKNSMPFLKINSDS